MPASKNITIQSINILNQSELLVSDHQSAITSYCKQPINEATYLGLNGFRGDSIADKKHHGGNDKAVCCYNADHFQHWKSELGFDLGNAAFGENLTLTGEASHEKNVFIGDRYQLGEAVVEVSEPRGPCYMIGIRYNFKQFPKYLQQTGFTGFYLRTIQPGWVSPGDALIHLSSHVEQISVMDVNHVRYHDPDNLIWLNRLANLQELTGEWRDRFKKMATKLQRI